MYTVGHFQVPKTLAFKIKLSEKNFVVQISVICLGNHMISSAIWNK